MFWEITRYGGAHACVNPALTQDHNKLDSDLIAHLIVNLVIDAPHTLVKSIRTMMNNEFGYNISYKEGMASKTQGHSISIWKLGKLIRNAPTMDGCHATLHARDCRFEHVTPIVQVDDTFLYGKYKGALLMATSQDGNRKCFPLAFALVEGILSSVEDANILWQPPYAHHVFCTRHLASNLHSEYKKKWLKKLFINMSYEPRRHAVDSLLSELRLMFSDGAEWIDNIPKEKWSLAYVGGMRYSHMTTNFAKSMNVVFKGVRALPITGLVKATYYRLNAYFTEHSRKYAAQLQAGRLYSETVHDRLNKAPGTDLD
ncbi:uncharacterized protein G2W53_029061 [Senna tora]|uniref:Transposase n=1 Tax=Senna tora TaxID=362788 RepID=A0A834WAB8_9FABA|nr:uncharacterized protein G2W53_029061 [Senna tora]